MTTQQPVDGIGRDLPELPKHMATITVYDMAAFGNTALVPAYTPDQMRDYARAALQSAALRNDVPDGDLERAKQSARFRAACYALKEIVEGTRGSERWAGPSGRRLKDTPEWAAFYNFVIAMRERGEPDALAASPQPAPGANPCKCIDCGGTEPTHSPDCTYMASLHGFAAQPQREGVDEVFADKVLVAFLGRAPEANDTRWDAMRKAVAAAKRPDTEWYRRNIERDGDEPCMAGISPPAALQAKDGERG